MQEEIYFEENTQEVILDYIMDIEELYIEYGDGEYLSGEML